MLSERLGKVVTGSGQSQKQFAELVGIDSDRVRNMLKGNVKTIKPDEALAVQQRFGIRDIWLRTGKGSMWLTKDEQALMSGDAAPLPAVRKADELLKQLGVEDADVTEFVRMALIAAARSDVGRLGDLMAEWFVGKANATKPNDYVMVPRYNVLASAGGGALVHDESVVDHLAFKADWVRQTMGLDPKNLALIEVRGDSMTPTIDDGDLVLLDTRPSQVKSEGVYVINLSGALLVKRIKLRLNGVVEIVSDNLKYGPETIAGDQLGAISIVGRVVWHGQKI